MTPIHTCCGTGGKPADSALCERIARIAEQGPDAVSRRLDELNAEWTIGRWVKVVCGLLLLSGVALTATVNPWWIGGGLVAVAGATLVQYLFFRRSWLGAAFAAAGVRSGAVIEDERIALRVLRGDFKLLPTLNQIQDREAVSRMAGEGGPALDEDDDMYDSREAAQMIAAGSAVARV
jgi:hypothetical protein